MCFLIELIKLCTVWSPPNLSSLTLCEKLSLLFLGLQPTSLILILQYLTFSFPPQDRYLPVTCTGSVLPIPFDLINFSSFRVQLMHCFLKEAATFLSFHDQVKPIYSRLLGHPTPLLQSSCHCCRFISVRAYSRLSSSLHRMLRAWHMGDVQ